MRYMIINGPMPTTTAPASVTTGTALKSLLQVKPIVSVRVVEWGISFDGSSAATPGKVELVEVDVAATVTAYANADLMKYDAEAVRFGDPTSTIFAVTSTNTSGYTSTSEGSVTAARMFDLQLLPPTGPYIKQFPLGERPLIENAKFLRIRVTFGTAINAYCYVILEA